MLYSARNNASLSFKGVAMRHFAAAMTMLGLLAGCNNQMEEERNAALANEARANAALKVEREARGNAERGEREAQALAEERRVLGGAITTFTMSLSVPCRLIPGRELERPRSLATGLVLSGNGGSWRLADSPNLPAQISESDGSGYTVIFSYTPETPAAFVGRNVDDLAKVQMLSTRYANILRNIGLEIDPSRPIMLNVKVNGITVVKDQGITVGNPDIASSDLSLDVASIFSNVSTAYDQGLRQEAQGKAAVQP